MKMPHLFILCAAMVLTGCKTGVLAARKLSGDAQLLLRQGEYSRERQQALLKKYANLEEYILTNYTAFAEEATKVGQPMNSTNVVALSNRIADASSQLTKVLGKAGDKEQKQRLQEMSGTLKAAATEADKLRATTQREEALAKAQCVRDTIVQDLLWLADAEYYLYKKSLYVGRGAANAFTDVLLLGVNSAGVLAGGESVKTILAAVSAGIVGTRGAVNQHLFREQATEVLISKMDALRSEKLTDIVKGLSENVVTYPLRRALIEVAAYVDQGSVVSALSAMHEDLAPIAQKADERLRQALAEANPEMMFKTLVDKASIGPETVDELADRVSGILGAPFSTSIKTQKQDDQTRSWDALLAAKNNLVDKNDDARTAAIYLKRINEALAAVLKSPPK